MPAPKGIKAVEWLSRRAKEQRGGRTVSAGQYDRSAPDSLAFWHDSYLDQLRARNYSEGTLEGRRDALKMFFNWAAERDLTQASQITRPILEAYQERIHGVTSQYSTNAVPASNLESLVRELCVDRRSGGPRRHTRGDPQGALLSSRGPWNGRRLPAKQPAIGG